MAIAATIGGYAVWVTVALVAGKLVYETFVSPLSKFPGPLAAKLTDGYRSLLTLGGDVDSHTRAWHDRWGTAVRVGPNAISLSDPDLIKAVYTTKNPWRKVQNKKPG
jgi:hypothetical protein